MNEQVWVGGAVFEIRHDETTRVDLIIKENRPFSDALFKMLGGKSHFNFEMCTSLRTCPHLNQVYGKPVY